MSICGEALCGGWGCFQTQGFHQAWLQQYWHHIIVGLIAYRLVGLLVVFWAVLQRKS